MLKSVEIAQAPRHLSGLVAETRIVIGEAANTAYKALRDRGGIPSGNRYHSFGVHGAKRLITSGHSINSFHTDSGGRLAAVRPHSVRAEGSLQFTATIDTNGGVQHLIDRNIMPDGNLDVIDRRTKYASMFMGNLALAAIVTGAVEEVYGTPVDREAMGALYDAWRNELPDPNQPDTWWQYANVANIPDEGLGRPHFLPATPEQAT